MIWKDELVLAAGFLEGLSWRLTMQPTLELLLGFPKQKKLE